MVPFVITTLAITVCVISYLLFLLDKKNKEIATLKLLHYQEKMEKSRMLVEHVSRIDHAVLTLKNYAKDVSEDFLSKNSLFEDVYSATKKLVLGTKNISQFLYVIGDIKAISTEGSIEQKIWKHIYHDVRTHTERLVEEALTDDAGIYIDVTLLFQAGIVRSHKLDVLLKKYQKRQPVQKVESSS